MSSASVAVIDIGSNSIKLLVAHRTSDGRIVSLKSRTIETRISAGISRARPQLTEAGMAAGLAAITALLADAAPYSPTSTLLVATSAVRDAANGDDFNRLVQRTTGHAIRILTGAEEAALIGRGLACDPALGALTNFYVFDLGGGSLECLAFRARAMEQAASLQLGCVRLTEKFMPDPSGPFSPDIAKAVAQHTKDVLAKSSFTFALPAGSVAIGTGGTVTTVRSVLAARVGATFESSSTRLTLDDLRALLTWLAPLTLTERQHIAGLPATRADIFPTALATIIAVGEFSGVTAFQNSLYNLRWGLAADALSSR